MTPPAPVTWYDRSSKAIRRLAAQPWSLFLVLLAVNALARPYAGITHDARLYSVQVLNQLDPGAYGEDLFFRYGSQDQFSIFSRFAAPFVLALGVESAFFLLYLVFNSLLILGLKRLVEALIRDRLVSTLALVFMMTAPLNFGGLDTLHVHEPFVTSRLMANAFVLLGLERTVRGRYIAALGLMMLGMAFHPLMAVGGLLIWAACLAWTLVPGKLLAILAVAVGSTGIVILLTPSVAASILGTMDEAWREVILQASPFNFVSEWQAVDWLNVAMGLIGIGVAAAAYWKGNPAQGRFLAVVAIVSVWAVLGTLLAESLPYALLLQGQPYRALWILKVLQIPFAFWFAARLWNVPTWYGPLAGVALVGILGLTTDLVLEWFFPLFFLPVLVLRYRGMQSAPLVPDWWRRSLLTSLALGFMFWALYKLVLLIGYGASLMQRLDLVEYARVLITNIGPITWLLFFGLFVGRTTRDSRSSRPRFARPIQVAVFAVFLLVQGGMALVTGSSSFRENFTRYGSDIRLVKEFLRQRHASAMPTIYSCLGRLDLVWLDLHAKSYFDWWQMGGVMFQRPMAIEGQRRARVVGPFELDRFREAGQVPEITRKQVSRFFALDFDTAQPELSDLRKLCQEDNIDFLLLTHDFPGLALARMGRLFLYDCNQVRAALNVPSPGLASTDCHSAGPVAARAALMSGTLSPVCEETSP